LDFLLKVVRFVRLGDAEVQETDEPHKVALGFAAEIRRQAVLLEKEVKKVVAASRKAQS
jgi:hypothetical protein